MALADRLNDAPQRIAGKPCSVGALEERLDGAERQALDAMLHTLGWSEARIYDALMSEGYEVGRQTINRHRSRACRCFKANA
jgi:hypothetical protein